MSKKQPYIVACIPAYNEEKNIAGVVIKTLKYVDKVIVCDDGSKDLTGDIAEKLGAEVVRHERNQGYGAALSTLFQRAKEVDADVMVILDGDGQHDPEDIPRLVKPVLEGEADIVIGSRFIGKGIGNVPAYRRFGIKMITKFAKRSTYDNITDAQSGYRVYSRRAIEAVKPSESGMGASTEILMKAKEHDLKIIELPVKIKYEKGSSKQNPIYHGLDVMLSIVKHMSIRHPLIFYGIPGTIAMLISLFFWIWTLQEFAATRQIITNITLIAVASTIVGLMLLTTAIILWVLITVVKEKG
ncbi:MAG: glycosyltransferase family 2 protein [Nitrososphaeria archaeon]